MGLNHGKIQDQITRASESYLRKEGKEQLKVIPKEKILGLKYTRGNKVLDTISGEEVEIVAGTRTTFAFHRSGSQGD